LLNTFHERRNFLIFFLFPEVLLVSSLATSEKHRLLVAKLFVIETLKEIILRYYLVFEPLVRNNIRICR
jgi:hypothetical protein